MDKEKIKTLLDVGEKSADEIRADAAAAILEIESGIAEIEQLTSDIEEKKKEIDRLKQSNIRLYNMITVDKPPERGNVPEKTFDDKVNDIINKYM